MGLLGESFDDPKTQGLLTLGLALLGSRGSLPQALAQAGQQGIGAYQAAVDQRDTRAMRGLQMQQAQLQLDQAQQQAEQQRQLRAWLQGLQSPQQQAVSQALAGGGGPTVANAAAMPKVDPAATLAFEAVKAGALPVQSYLGMLQKDETPVALAEGGQLVTRGGKVLASNPKQPDLPSAVKEFQFGQQNPAFSPWLASMKRAGATNVSVNTEKQLLGTLAQGLGKQLDDGLASARGAASSIQTAQTLRQAAESGKMLAGPGAPAAVFGLQVGQMLGLTGKNADEVLLNTRTAIQAMAKAELDAAQMMKGQGQITEAERDIIRRAASGNVSLTAPEISLLAQAMEKTARGKIAAHQQAVKALEKVPGAAALMPFYSVDEPPPYAGGWSITPVGK